MIDCSYYKLLKTLIGQWLIKWLEVRHTTIDNINKATGSRTTKMKCGSGRQKWGRMANIIEWLVKNTQTPTWRIFFFITCQQLSSLHLSHIVCNKLYIYMDTYGVCVCIIYEYLIIVLLPQTINSTVCVYNKGNEWMKYICFIFKHVKTIINPHYIYTSISSNHFLRKAHSTSTTMTSQWTLAGGKGKAIPVQAYSMPWVF
jgi:hypothetical protein